QSTASGSPVSFMAMTGADNVNVNTDNTGAAEVLFPATQTLAALSIGAGGKATLSSGGAKVLTVNTISLAGGQLDLTDNDMVVKAMTTASVSALIGDGLNGASPWTGNGIISSTAAADTNITTALG